MSTESLMTCDEFALRLADYLEGDASAGERIAVDAHAAGCAACAELLADLRMIPAQAAALPLLEPSRDLWAGIADRIDARILPFDAAPRTAAVARRPWLRSAAAAAALVVITAGITHFATREYLAPTGASVPQVATVAGAVVTGPATPNADIESTLTESGAPTPTEPADARVATRAPREARPVSRSEEPAPVRRASGSAVRLVSATPGIGDAEPVYDQEITKLRAILRQRHTQLDPATIAVLEQSVAVIDSAIAQSRAALAKDPASGFLATQLNRSLEKKVELLRTAALLPSRT